MERLRDFVKEFPRQFWILFGGTLVNSTGGGMVFPFITLYLHEQLGLSLPVVGLALSLWAGSQLVGQLLGGSLADRFGRKKLMLFSLGTGVVLLPIFGLADTFAAAVIVSMLMGFTGAMYQPARDAMVADLVGSEKRVQAYGLVRVVSNLGIAIGPAIGGFLISRSYLLTFTLSATATLLFFLVTIWLIRETKPTVAPAHTGREAAPGNFLSILRNTRFVVFCTATTFVILASVQLMMLLPVYMKDEFRLDASYFGWVMTTNATMVVLFQFLITRATARLPRLPLMAAGALLYAAGVGSVALDSTFVHFIASMAIATVGEMIVVPTATAVTADLAPADMRGRYMSALGLTWSMGFGISPILGGFISEWFSPRALWPIMALAAVVGGFMFLLLARRTATHPAPAVTGSPAE